MPVKLVEGTTIMMTKPLIISDTNPKSLKIKKQIVKISNNAKIKRPNLIIVIVDGFMLQTLKKIKNHQNHFTG